MLLKSGAFRQLTGLFNVLKSQNVIGIQHSLNNANSTRLLYTPAALGIDSYVNFRERTVRSLGNVTNKFAEKMSNYLDGDEKAPIFTEDLKNMVYLAKPEDYKLLLEMAVRYQKQNQNMRFSSFTFGPVLARFYYTQGAADEALKAIMHEELQGFFDQFASYLCVMDLLLEKEMYNEVFSVFEHLLQRDFVINRFPREAATLLFASALKLNTAEAYEKAKSIFSKMMESNSAPNRRGIAFLSRLSVLQNEPEFAIEICANIRNPNYVSIKNIRLSAEAKLKRYEEALQLMRDVIERDAEFLDQGRETTKGFFCKNSISEAQEAFEASENEELIRKFNKTLDGLKQLEEVGESNIEDILFRPIEARIQRPQQGEGDRFNRGGYNRESRPPRFADRGRFERGEGYERQFEARRPGPPYRGGSRSPNANRTMYREGEGYEANEDVFPRYEGAKGQTSYEGRSAPRYRSQQNSRPGIMHDSDY